jgi:hypothetical protein
MRIVLPLLLALWLAPAGAENPALAGTWILNTDESDDTEKAMKRVMPKRNRDSDRRGKLPRIGKNPDADKITTNRLVLSDSDLSITIDGAKVSIDYGEQKRRTLFTDGRGQSVSALDGGGTGPGYSFGLWEDDMLFIESRKQQGMILYETFRLDPNPDTLRHKISVSIPAAGESTDILRVYNRAPAIE